MTSSFREVEITMLATRSMTAIGRYPDRGCVPRQAMTGKRVLGALATATLLLAAATTVCHHSTAARGATDEPSQPDHTLQLPIPASQSDFVAEIYQTLKTQHERMTRIANPISDRPDATEHPRDEVFDQSVTDGRQQRRSRPALDPRYELVNQAITVESAEANYKNATLAREIAEIGVTEYAEGIFIQDQATAQGEAKLAESDVDRSWDYSDLCKVRRDRSRRYRRVRLRI
jgi:hypothetical protein